MFNMIKIKKAVSASITLAALINLGCSEDSHKVQQSSLSQTTFKITGSANAPTVAMNPIEKIFHSLIPRAVASNPSNLTSKDGESISLTSLWIVIKEIEFKSKEHSEEEDDSELEEESSFKGPYVADLLAATPAALDTQSIPSKTYRRIKIKYEKCDHSTLLAKNPNAPSDLVNNSIYLAGTCGNSCNFSFKMDDGVELQIAGPNGINAQSDQELLVNIQLANVIKQINFSDLTFATDKNISHTNRVTKTSNSDLCPTIDPSANDYYTCLKKGLEQESHFAKDDNRNGEIDDDEESVKQ